MRAAFQKRLDQLLRLRFDFEGGGSWSALLITGLRGRKEHSHELVRCALQVRDDIHTHGVLVAVAEVLGRVIDVTGVMLDAELPS